MRNGVKKVLICFGLTFVSVLHAQVDLKDIPTDIKYCQLFWSRKNSETVHYNFGEKYFSKKGLIKDGNLFKFKNKMDF